MTAKGKYQQERRERKAEAEADAANKTWQMRSINEE
jgi:hypothetical protein